MVSHHVEKGIEQLNMRKEMGNQNTSGIVEEKAANEAVVEVKEASSAGGLEHENEILVQENGTQEFQEKKLQIDSHEYDAQSDKLASGENVSEGVHESITDDCGARATDLLHLGSSDEESKELDLEGGTSKFNNEVHDELSDGKGEIVRTDLNVESLNSLHDVVDITSRAQENKQLTERVETLEASNLGPILEETRIVDVKTTCLQNIDGVVVHDINDHNAKKKKTEMVVTDTDSGEGATIGVPQGNSNEESTDNLDNVRKEVTFDHIANISSADITPSQNEPSEECLVLAEESLTSHGVGNGDDSSFVDQTDQPPHQEMSRSISCINDQFDIEKTKEKTIDRIDSLSCSEVVNPVEEANGNDIRDHMDGSGHGKSGHNEILEDPIKANDLVTKTLLVQMEGSTEMGKIQEENNLIGESILENVVHSDEDSPATIINKESNGTKKNFQAISSRVTEAEIQAILTNEQNSNIENPISDAVETYMEHENAERLSTESNNNDGVKVALRKSPSFEFGLPFRSEESDQTPLLYPDKTTKRSFSSCAALRYQNTNNFGNSSLQHEDVEMKEKTIRMERSSSENLYKKLDKANVVMQEKHDASFAANKKQENGLKGSTSEEDGAVNSPKGSAKRKPRSLLFATCICCTTEAIS